MKDIQSKAREEVLRVMGDAPHDVFPTLEQTRELPYINMIIKEVLMFIHDNNCHQEMTFI